MKICLWPALIADNVELKLKKHIIIAMQIYCIVPTSTMEKSIMGSAIRAQPANWVSPSGVTL